MTSAVSIATPRAQSIVQRAYIYIVALVAIHMVVLGVANLLRVIAEIALGAPSGGFTGLPFVFADFNRPRDLYREQASLAIALLAVGTPAWWFHFRAAQRAAARLVEERASALRSLYIHTVVLVTALLVFGYGQRALRLVLQGTTFPTPPASPTTPVFFPLEPDWPARAAGAAAMALVAAAVLAFHLRLSAADRRAAPLGERAVAVRHLAFYALVVIGFLFASFNATQALSDVWRRVVDAVAPLPGVVDRPLPPSGFTPPPQPSRDEQLGFQLLGTIPAIVAGIALWLGTWLSLQRGLVRGPDVDVERRSVTRKLAIYLIVFVCALAVLFAATIVLSTIGARLLGDPVTQPFTSLWVELGSPLAGLVIFVPMWLFHRGVVESDARRETEIARAATVRRLYTYLISAIGLAMAAIGTAGTLGVIGSQLLSLNTHSHSETATYIALVLVGGAAWAFHWRTARSRLDDDERRSLPRRLYLYAAILGGVLGLLAFGSAALYRVLNGVLAFSFTVETWHDIWHFSVDSAVSATVASSAFRALRADRAVLGATGDEVYAVSVLVRAPDRDAARARVAAALAGDSDLTVRG